MPMSVMNIGHVVMLISGVFMLMRMDSVHFIVSVCGVSMSVAVLVK